MDTFNWLEACHYSSAEPMPLTDYFLAEETGFNLENHTQAFYSPTCTFESVNVNSSNTVCAAIPEYGKSAGPTLKHTCGICFQKFATRKEFSAHARIHRSEKKYECDFCGKRFGQRTTLMTHRRLHTGEKSFQCSICYKQFSDPSSYIKHERIHSGYKPYTCDVCGKSFSQSGNLTRHKRNVYNRK